MTNRIGLFSASMAVMAITASSALAVPYASAVRNTSGSTYEFVLNEPADYVTVLRDGANPVTINTPAAGRHTFDLGAFSSYEIQVGKDAPKAWTELSDTFDSGTATTEQLFQYFFRPTGVVVNDDPSSEYFGTIYVSHPEARVNAGPVTTPRVLGDGVYSLTADLIGVNLAGGFSVTDPEDATQAKAPGWTVDQSNGSSPWRLSLDDSGNLIAADFSDQSGGIKYASPDLTTGGLVLAEEDGVLPLLTNDTGFEEVHGSILSKVSVTGTVGVDLTVWAIDEDYDLDGDTFTVDPETNLAQGSTYHPLRWDVGPATDYDQPPTIVINKETLTVDDDNGTPGDDSDDFNDFQYTLSPEAIGGVITNNMHYEEQHEKFYLLQSRTHGNESGILIVSADPNDADNPTIEWSSKRFSYDNGLDGNTSPGDVGEGLQDIFRNIDDVVISADGTKMYVTRNRQFFPGDDDVVTPDPLVYGDGDNPVLGGESNAPGGILVIPLDENGLPDLQVDDNGTPGDTSDDFITNIESIPYDSPGRTLRSQVAVDAAGNVYHVDNLTERLKVFSPGGNTIATTTSDGLFSVQTIESLLGDYNGNGVVDAADFTVWRDALGNSVTEGSGADGNSNGVIDGGDYDVWVNNFGNSLPALSEASTVPEPASGLLLVLVAAFYSSSRRRKL
ncbi:hypothetical protein Mal64_27620 [Pseudobythopirellula maris]|uniref:PEP-CTERM protein-sorting domain-containing protein n=1 Tax=Pseudobythopirellula maris TaxID=2527991 RepID=A0A5C5ZIN7_9BACT|nr:PEP-CTERM sorting domain-containing protein [Pseudobythopirellula maris]TWT87224.1 hypothetical protein Mal64_27620 [Pseudobythopirellula maris]